MGQMLSDREAREMGIAAVTTGDPGYDAYVFHADAYCRLQRLLRERGNHVPGLTDQSDSFLGVPLHVGYTAAEVRDKTNQLIESGRRVCVCVDHAEFLD